VCLSGFEQGQGNNNNPLTTMPRPFTELREFEVGGPTTFTVPQNVNRIMVELWAGSGGGGGPNRVPNRGGGSTPGFGGGGGAGAYARYYVDAAAGQIVNLNIGRGGAGGNKIIGTPGATDGRRGGDTTVMIGTIVITAVGGDGGRAPSQSPDPSTGLFAGTGGAGGSRNGLARTTKK
jgi:hypothetical protein